MQITKQELEFIYCSMTPTEAAKKLGVSIRTLYKTLRREGIPLKGREQAFKIRVISE